MTDITIVDVPVLFLRDEKIDPATHSRQLINSTVYPRTRNSRDASLYTVVEKATKSTIPENPISNPAMMFRLLK